MTVIPCGVPDEPAPPEYRWPSLRLLVGLEAIRLRPGLYIGPDRTTVNRLAAVAIAAFVRSGAGSNRVVAAVRADGSLTVCAAAALAPVDTYHCEGVEQPAILDAMLRLSGGRERVHEWLDGQGSILTALAAPIGVSCRRGGSRLDAWFSRGGLVQPVRVSPDDRPDATAIGLRADSQLLSGTLDLAGLREELLAVDPDAALLADLSCASGDFWSALGDQLEQPLFPTRPS